MRSTRHEICLRRICWNRRDFCRVEKKIVVISLRTHNWLVVSSLCNCRLVNWQGWLRRDAKGAGSTSRAATARGKKVQVQQGAHHLLIFIGSSSLPSRRRPGQSDKIWYPKHWLLPTRNLLQERSSFWVCFGSRWRLRGWLPAGLESMDR